MALFWKCDRCADVATAKPDGDEFKFIQLPEHWQRVTIRSPYSMHPTVEFLLCGGCARHMFDEAQPLPQKAAM